MYSEKFEFFALSADMGLRSAALAGWEVDKAGNNNVSTVGLLYSVFARVFPGALLACQSYEQKICQPYAFPE
jgi:hypothetical protein